MKFLRYDRTTLSNLEESLYLEHIRTNRLGGISCTSIVDCNTRKYHGLLSVPLPHLSTENHLLLSSLDATIVQHNTPFNLAVHLYEDGTVYPNGQKYLEEYYIDKNPVTVFRVGGVVLQKESLFCHHRNQLIIKYTLIDAHSETTLRLRPLLAFREVSQLTYENPNINTQSTLAAGGRAYSLYPNYPLLYMQMSQSSTFKEEAYWQKKLYYPKEQIRGYAATEDLYTPGYFEVILEKNKPVYFSASLDECTPTRLEATYEQELSSRKTRSNYEECLQHAAQQFYFSPTANQLFLLAGYPWFGVRARDLLIALPGCTMRAQHPEHFHRILQSFIPLFKAFIDKESIPPYIQGIRDPDVGLWAIRAIQLYLETYPQDEHRLQYLQFVKSILQYFLQNEHPIVQLRENGLLYAYSQQAPVSWMDAHQDGRAVVPRKGYMVDLNALWYNAIKFYAQTPEASNREILEKWAEKIEKHFPEIFLNEHGYLWDYVCDECAKDYSVRPNMLFAVSLPYSPLSAEQQRNILELITKELLTPKGLRTLSPRSEGYERSCCGNQQHRTQAYYNGSAWPWLLGSYIDAYLKIHGKSGLSFLQRLLVEMQEEVRKHGISTLSELYDGNTPYDSHGGISFAMSVGEILRATHKLQKANNDLGENISSYYLSYSKELL